MNASHQIVGNRRLVSLRSHLSERDLAIVAQVAKLRFLTATQIRSLHFPIGEAHRNDLSAIRSCQLVLTRLVRDGLLIRLERRRGGVRAGSDGFTYVLGPVGQRLVEADGPRRRFREPTVRFLEHSLAISQLVVNATLADRNGILDLLVSEAEPTCHRRFPTGESWDVLKPDLFLSLGVGDTELHWFVEQDMATESVQTVLRKCVQYQSYYDSGKEQERAGIFPRVCWIVPNETRALSLRQAIRRSRKLHDRLFVVIPADKALDVLMGGAS